MAGLLSEPAPACFLLDKDAVVDYMMKFDLLTTKVKKLNPILNFQVPLFKVSQDLRVAKHAIVSTPTPS